jgi:hypothetical protein
VGEGRQKSPHPQDGCRCRIGSGAFCPGASLSDFQQQIKPGDADQLNDAITNDNLIIILVNDGQPAAIPDGYTYGEEELNWVYRNLTVSPIGCKVSGFAVPDTADKN